MADVQGGSGEALPGGVQGLGCCADGPVAGGDSTHWPPQHTLTCF